MKKPILNKLMPIDGVHSIMTKWANDQSKPDFVARVVFEDGSQLIERFERATRDVAYSFRGEKHHVTIDKNTFTLKSFGLDDEISIGLLRKWYNNWFDSKACFGIKVVKIEWCFD